MLLFQKNIQGHTQNDFLSQIYVNTQCSSMEIREDDLHNIQLAPIY